MNRLISFSSVFLVLFLTYCTGYKVSQNIIKESYCSDQFIPEIETELSDLSEPLRSLASAAGTENPSLIIRESDAFNNFIENVKNKFNKNEPAEENSVDPDDIIEKEIDEAILAEEAAYFETINKDKNSFFGSIISFFDFKIGNQKITSDYNIEYDDISNYNEEDKDYEALKAELEAQNEAVKAEKLKTITDETVYGFSLGDYDSYSSKIKKNQFLSQILGKHNVEYATITKLAHKAKKIFDVKKLNYNKPYTLLTKKGEESPRYFIYDPSDYFYVVYDLEGETETKVINRKVEKGIKSAGGVIYSSLYETMIKNELSPLLVNELADVYAWTIDFYHIQKNDKFKIIYEEELIEGESVGIGKILAAVFEHKGETFYAFKYEQDDLDDYFDEKGKSLRKQFLKAPLKYSRISSRYTGKRFHPVLKRYKSHLGTDYAAPKGTPIRAVGDGVIEKAGYAKYNGNWVKLKHNSTYTTGYLHMSKIAKGIKKGKKVKQGDIIGYVGSTGLATGPHLCFRFWKNGNQVDPFKQKLPPSDPINPQGMNEYNEYLEELKPKLGEITYF